MSDTQRINELESAIIESVTILHSLTSHEDKRIAKRVKIVLTMFQQLIPLSKLAKPITVDTFDWLKENKELREGLANIQLLSKKGDSELLNRIHQLTSEYLDSK